MKTSKNTMDSSLLNVVQQAANKMFATKSLSEMQVTAIKMEKYLKSFEHDTSLCNVRPYSNDMDKSELGYLLVLLAMKKDLCEEEVKKKYPDKVFPKSLNDVEI